MKPEIKLLIVDLDNTLYDWVTYFVKSFYSMVEVAANLLNISEDELLTDLKEVHQIHHNSEQPFALLDTKIVKVRYPKLSRHERALLLDPAFYEFNKMRDQLLILYPTVYDTLRHINEQRCLIVGHTEASVANAQFRLDKLQISKFIKSLYAIQDTGEGHPDPMRHREILARYIPVISLGAHERKPDIKIVEKICSDYAISPRSTLYVGDSISRDISMAKLAGVHSAWARYGTKYDGRLWTQLVRVTHWTSEDVQRSESAQRLYGQVQPEVTLNENFGELLKNFHFAAS